MGSNKRTNYYESDRKVVLLAFVRPRGVGCKLVCVCNPLEVSKLIESISSSRLVTSSARSAQSQSYFAYLMKRIRRFGPGRIGRADFC